MSLSGFASAWWFLLLLVVAGLAALYVVLQRVLRKRSLRFANLALLERVAPKRQGWYRHVPAAFLMVAFMLLTVALAGPTAEQKVPRNRATVMLVIDVSLSMKATDVQPTRLEAAQVAAKSFAEGLTPGINLGLISFAGSATVLVAPTTDRSAVSQGIDGLKLAQSTATGDAIVAALSAIDSFGKVVGGADGPPPARVVLMTDGKETVGTRKATDAAGDAKEAGIPISTISFGTERGSVDINGKAQEVPVDDESMKEIAKISGGEFFKAASAEELRRVYDTLGEQIGYEKKQADASRPWLVAGTLVAMLAVAGSLLLGQRLP
ncbi:VWA domain-containing protein [Actinosynnema pretiosum subsp. pretiosum]|uniref:von Willebrand factor type A n=2 Tax=Actinosynnema TaxID=40566 RepID=C6WH24_ACTMD|nr:VWA domain-containing protein [Actinosynnema mirum]ACU36092.1 von Willebrand factor type A [Actinosynnema mirum DSM 43827]AXX29545.1 putative MEMBRANE PROTEIN [Actinosynnema pretiosum subsp. pretiosum]QUF06220.1 VWA domain-containing protein [Actinosynnema pretiosum subsp. pretiosum]